MSVPIHLDPRKRHDFVFLFDVKDGNPNGDPDSDNMPRVDYSTRQGLVTDAAIKRRIRNWVDLTKGTEERFKIYIQDSGIALNDLHQRAYSALGLKSTGSKQDRETVNAVRAWMCENFWDIRTFGAVMTTTVNAGNVRGPVQITIARSIDPIEPHEIALTRVAITKPEDAKYEVGADGHAEGKGKTTEMGRKWIIPYALYIGYGFFNPKLAEQTGMTSKDLDLVYEGLIRGWEIDRAASRGMMACRGLYVFTHENPLGNAPAHKLHERIIVRKRPEVTVARAFTDYEVIVNRDNLPEGVVLTTLFE